MRLIDMRVAGSHADDAYDFTFPSRPERWQGLAEKLPGLPPLVVDGRGRIVCGHDHLRLLQQRGDAGCHALQVDLAPAECLLLNFNVLQRLFGLNLQEKLLFVKKIVPLLPCAEIQRRADLGFALSAALLQRLDVLLLEPFRSCMAGGRIGLKTALKLAGQAEADRRAQLRVLQACAFSESRQWQMAQWLEEAAFREKKPIAALLSALDLPEAGGKPLPPAQVLQALHRLRFPLLARWEGEWESWSKKATGEPGVSLHHAPLFADGEVRIILRARDRAHAEKLLARLKKRT